MIQLIWTLIIISTMTHPVIFDFNKESNPDKWVIVDDVVMGGRSSSSFGLTEDGHGVFQGAVSLENNGGFSSVRYRSKRMPINGSTKVVIKLKGDGKNYQFRIKANAGDYYSYIATFTTNGKWQEIEIPLKDMYPSFRGRRLNQPNFASDSFEEVAFLIGNKKKEEFKLLIDKIELK